MHALRNFVLGVLQDASSRQLQHLSETLRLPPMAAKADVVAGILHLIELDRDSALGIFVTWHQTAVAGDDQVIAPTAFANAFVPIPGSTTTDAIEPPTTLFGFELDEELRVVARDVSVLEAAYKDAEVHVHSGRASYEKIKRFLQTLTQLRAKDIEFRRLLLQKNDALGKDNARLSRTETHTRAQLEFFLGGCTRLRSKHDALVEDIACSTASDDMAAHVLLELYGGEVGLTHVLTRTLEAKCAHLSATCANLDAAHATIASLHAKVYEKNTLVATMQAKWDAAAKDATCAKFQLRKCRKRLRDSNADAATVSYLRYHCLQLQRMVTDLLSVSQIHALALTDAKANFTKSVEKASIAWRVLSYLRFVSNPRLDPSVASVPPQFPMIVPPPRAPQDVREALPVVVVLGMSSLVHQVVLRLSSQFGYAHFDVDDWHKGLIMADPETPEDAADDGERPLDLPRLARTMANMRWCLLHDHAFTADDVRRLIQHGCRVGMVLDFSSLETDPAWRRLPLYTPLHPSMVGLDSVSWPSVDAMVAAVAATWQRRVASSGATIEWDSITCGMNERCAMFAEELGAKMAVVWAAHQKAVADKAAATAAAAAAKKRSNTPAKGRSPTPSKPGRSSPTAAAGKKPPATRSKATPAKPTSPAKPPASRTTTGKVATPKKPLSPPKSPAVKRAR
ncbi:hypothetical protein, variant [Saprolegnia diclina VS20]|uniref:Uncharacterized protein n=1 Tax=Saprolegnia diclina (strain VS20) TaxID=1156394 RepID=T0R6S1_SAPDV|nr:hypothetical protein, variant [Saprolegnia diclina VS20]EQC25197.1 hypothetical protein, variant [Saprolegnia diclina VS20]|eukprot:XP_008621368.1 hypothetical protein, variant [Saprolegnia diclina VS20]